MQVAGHKQRAPLHPQEKWFLAIVLIQLVFMPWAFGTRDVWSQLIALVLSAVGFVVALWPRFYSSDYTQGPEFNLRSWPRLMRFPLFWLGLALLIYLGLQASNPSWRYFQNPATGGWRLIPLKAVAWLPTSVEAPFERFNIWRQIIIYAIVWLTVCSLWIGFTRRKSLHILLGSLVANASILALVGFIHKASGEQKILWLRVVRNAASFASFVYQNHAGSYFGLLSFVALGLAVWHFFEGRKRMARSTPAALWLLAALLLIFAVVFSLSRGAMISVGLFGLGALIAMIILRFTTTTRSTVPVIVPTLVVLGTLTVLGWMVQQIDFSEVYHRFERLTKLQGNDPSVQSRNIVRESAGEMYRDHWVRGIGAGAFRDRFAKYIGVKAGNVYWSHAHIDWLEIPIELGLAGVILIAGAMAWIARTWFRWRGWRHPLALMIAFGVGQVMTHALMDFPFQNAAILTTWWALLIISLRWLELDGDDTPRQSTNQR